MTIKVNKRNEKKSEWRRSDTATIENVNGVWGVRVNGFIIATSDAKEQYAPHECHSWACSRFLYVEKAYKESK